MEKLPVPAAGPVMPSICSKNVSGSSPIESSGEETGTGANKVIPGWKVIVKPEI